MAPHSANNRSQTLLAGALVRVPLVVGVPLGVSAGKFMATVCLKHGKIESPKAPLGLTFASTTFLICI